MPYNIEQFLCDIVWWPQPIHSLQRLGWDILGSIPRNSTYHNMVTWRLGRIIAKVPSDSTCQPLITSDYSLGRSSLIFLCWISLPSLPYYLVCPAGASALLPPSSRLTLPPSLPHKVRIHSFLFSILLDTLSLKLCLVRSSFTLLISLLLPPTILWVGHYYLHFAD